MEKAPKKYPSLKEVSLATLLHTIFTTLMFQIEMLTQAKCIIILLEDLTSLDLTSVPKLNSLLQQNVVLR